MAEVAVPLLDNIETSPPTSQALKSANINAPELSNDENLYITLENITYYKTLSLEVADILKEYGVDNLEWRERAQKIDYCGTRLAFDKEGKLIGANFCRQRVCPCCQRRRSLKVKSDFYRIQEALSGCAWVHLVLTVPNVYASELGNTLDDMQRCSSRFFRIAEVKRAFLGVARCTEVSYNDKVNTYHPHFHCLVAVKRSYFSSRNYLSRDRLRRLWSACWDMRSLKIENAKDGDIISSGEAFDGYQLLQLYIAKADEGAVAEIAKYAVKPLELELPKPIKYTVLTWLLRALHGRRLIQTFGIVKQTAAALKIDLNADPEEAEQVDRTNVRCYNWSWHDRRFIFSLTEFYERG